VALDHDDKAVFLITGPSASGKSTVARLLAARFRRGVHLEGDFFRQSIVSGRHEMTPDPTPQALEQLRLRYRLAAAAADAYFERGFTVALEDVVAGRLLEDVAAQVRSRPLHTVVLLPSIEAVAARAASRTTAGYDRWSIEQLHELFANETPRLGIWLDSSNQTAEETVDEVLARTIGLLGR
jgi:chloramphenicol 3-O-phosphotransferase